MSRFLTLLYLLRNDSNSSSTWKKTNISSLEAEDAAAMSLPGTATAATVCLDMVKEVCRMYLDESGSNFGAGDIAKDELKRSLKLRLQQWQTNESRGDSEMQGP